MILQRQNGVDTITYPNVTLNNRLWIHYEGAKWYLSTVHVNRIDWENSESSVIIEGFLQNDKFLLDIADKSLAFEVRTGKCGDPTDYEQGQRLMLMENLKSFTWWTENVTSRGENSCTLLHCQFTCDWIEICDL